MEQLLVSVDGNLHHLGVGVHLPCGITTALLHFCTCQFKGGAHRIGHIAQVAGHVGTMAGNEDDAVIGCLHAGNIAGSLHHVVEGRILTDGEYSIVEGLKTCNELAAHLFRQYLLSICALQGSTPC